MISKKVKSVFIKPRPPQNAEENPNFWASAFAWNGSVTPKILPRTCIFVLYSVFITLLHISFDFSPNIDLTPFELCGAVIGVLLVFRTNAGYDRWWEARKHWGGIVNQSRNLASGVLAYGPQDPKQQKQFIELIASFAFTTKNSLRKLDASVELKRKLNLQFPDDFSQSHQPTYISFKMAQLLNTWKAQQAINLAAFLNLDKERLKLLEYVGACERILKTPMPLVYVIKVRRFLLLFLLLVPIGVVHLTGLLTPMVTMLVAYPLLSLDQIGRELQNPFATDRLSHLPLDEICTTIQNNCVTLLENHFRNLLNQKISENIKNETQEPDGNILKNVVTHNRPKPDNHLKYRS